MAKEEIKQTENNHDLEDKSTEVKVDQKKEGPLELAASQHLEHNYRAN